RHVPRAGGGEEGVGGEDHGVVIGLVAGGGHSQAVDVGRPRRVGGQVDQGRAAAHGAVEGRRPGRVHGQAVVPVHGAGKRDVPRAGGGEERVGGEDHGVVIGLVAGGGHGEAVEVGRPRRVGGQVDQGRRAPHGAVQGRR